MHKTKRLARVVTGAVALACSLWMSPASSQGFTTFGDPDCGQWVADKTPFRLGWLMGYLSGVNNFYEVMGKGPRDPLELLNSADQAFLWMDNWCKANPLSKVSYGAMTLFLELMAKRAKEKK